MAGLISLQQGPLGVAASVRRPEPKPGATGIARVASGAGAQLDPASRHAELYLPDRNDNTEPNQEPIGTVEPATLFEVSRLAALLLPAGQQSPPPSARSGEPWMPPQSSLALRDRSV